MTPHLALLGQLAVAAQIATLTPAEWREDVAALGERLPAAHIDAFHAVPEGRFMAALDSLAAAADTASPDAMLVGLARVVALVGDGHTSARVLRPDLHGFPVLLQAQDDGLRIRRAETSAAQAVGARVVRIEGREIGEATARVSEIIAADNASGRRAWLPYYLITEEVLRGLGLLDARPGLTLEVELLDGTGAEITLTARTVAEVQAFFASEPRRPSYRFEWLPAERALYARIDRLVSDPAWPFTAFVDSLIGEWDRRSPERLILDLRSLGGGNHISLPLIHALLRRESLLRDRRLLVLIGRGTFSAGQNLVTLLATHLDPVFVGEPTSGRPNHYGVLGRFVLPNSGIEIRYSRYFNQDSDPADYRHWQEPHLRAAPDVRAELEGRDPALEAALAWDGTMPWDGVLDSVQAAFDSGGAVTALTIARRNATLLRQAGWIAERILVRLGYRALRGGNAADAAALFRATIELRPDAWNGWDSLGESLSASGDREEAIAAYRRSVALNPYNENARRELRVLLK